MGGHSKVSDSKIGRRHRLDQPDAIVGTEELEAFGRHSRGLDLEHDRSPPARTDDSGGLPVGRKVHVPSSQRRSWTTSTVIGWNTALL